MQLNRDSIDANFRGQSLSISLAGIDTAKELVNRVTQNFGLETCKLALKGGKLISESTTLSLAEAGRLVPKLRYCA